MSMHIYRALLEIYSSTIHVSGTSYDYAHDLQFKIGHAVPFRSFAYEDFIYIDSWCKAVMEAPDGVPSFAAKLAVLRNTIENMIPSYAREWVRLGKPKNSWIWEQRSLFPDELAEEEAYIEYLTKEAEREDSVAS